jgi:site-specific DNA recombinase
LLSFAQFERELTGERIRDKVAASKKKGMWMGGVVPLGYDCADHRLIINQPEAESVREIFRQYLRLGCVKKLKDHLERKQIRSKTRTSSAGRTSGGTPFSRGALYHLLNNRVYIGEIVHQSQSYLGQHEAIVPKKVWDQVAARLEANNQARRTRKSTSTPSLLSGIVFDTKGVRLTPTHAVKNGKRYRYYTSQAAIQGNGERGIRHSISCPSTRSSSHVSNPSAARIFRQMRLRTRGQSRKRSRDRTCARSGQEVAPTRRLKTIRVRQGRVTTGRNRPDHSLDGD